MEFHSFADATLLTTDLAWQLEEILRNAIEQRGQAYLVVSGGKTPVELFKKLAKSSLSWDKVTITLTDERCVPLESEHRNERLVRQLLLQDHAQKAHFLSLSCEEGSKIQAIKQQFASLPMFDAVILGMGEDGHTASLFPGAPELRAGLEDDDALLLVNPTTAPYQRISLSKQRLLKSRAIFFHVVGKNKLQVLHRAMSEYDPINLPASAFLNNQHVNVQVMYAP